MNKKSNIPAFVSVTVFAVGLYDLLRGIMHTFLLDYSAITFAGLDLSTPQASDLLRLLGSFGVSNLITGTMLLIAAFNSRKLSLVFLGVVPFCYGLGHIVIHPIITLYPATHARWFGIKPILVYISICTIVFVAGLAVTLYRNQCSRGRRQLV